MTQQQRAIQTRPRTAPSPTRPRRP
ncbi:hypothetical protein E2C01_099125 [Portunus trituberculatus]|uniref:Uncharacterized protein n=1 Tax=Portunus trituberculatus TaxID=210409 RepID=A0A5B7KG03_PORTR|nr:hypothetical protein [Portunus trituberculatus]